MDSENYDISNTKREELVLEEGMSMDELLKDDKVQELFAKYDYDSRVQKIKNAH